MGVCSKLFAKVRAENNGKKRRKQNKKKNSMFGLWALGVWGWMGGCHISLFALSHAIKIWKRNRKQVLCGCVCVCELASLAMALLVNLETYYAAQNLFLRQTSRWRSAFSFEFLCTLSSAAAHNVTISDTIPERHHCGRAKKIRFATHWTMTTNFCFALIAPQLISCVLRRNIFAHDSIAWQMGRGKKHQFKF